ncbi:hypothetical protein DPMN_115790 [Dreissena polymorpha]|uniref:Uncharacterized protein n=1 Tax=Dreissena polymorpha TaxID=45954 RepID=A0A9D4QT97_DREPO|nr:hypothetical protein DPMN_115790 [Dreissena polymorpha]
MNMRMSFFGNFAMMRSNTLQTLSISSSSLYDGAWTLMLVMLRGLADNFYTDEDESAGDRGSTENAVDYLCPNNERNNLRPVSVNVSTMPLACQLVGQIVDIYARMEC